MQIKCIPCLIAGVAIGAGIIYFFTGTSNSTPNAVLDDTITETDTMTLTLTSSAFEHNTSIPARYACDDENINPPLSIGEVPEDTISLALIMDDPDIPQQFKDARGIDSFDHWALFNIDPSVSEIAVGDSPGIQGANGQGNSEYTGPCPPPEFEPTEHRYFFKLFALDTTLTLTEGASKADILEALEGNILEETELIGLFDRSNN